MQPRIESRAYRYHNGADISYDAAIDHPERMLFFATLFGVISWSLIGLIAWGLWQLLQ